MACMLLLGLLPSACFGYVPTISPSLVFEGVLGDLGQGHPGRVPLRTCLGQDPQFGLVPSSNQMVFSKTSPWDQLLASFILIAFFGHVPTFYYREEADAPFKHLNVDTHRLQG